MRHFELAERREWVPSLPEEFNSPYHLGQYAEARLTQIMWKYLVRQTNCERAWARINHHMPETLQSPKPLDILELSTAHGAMLEIWRNQGHSCVGTDYPWTDEAGVTKANSVNRPWQRNLLDQLSFRSHENEVGELISGWPYQPVIESLGLDVRLFDGGILPYPFPDKSFDVVCCYQALDAYAHPSRWIDIVKEMCRISRKTVMLGFNPAPGDKQTDEVFQAAARQAWLELRNFSDCGFNTVFFELGQTNSGTHPTACKLMSL